MMCYYHECRPVVLSYNCTSFKSEENTITFSCHLVADLVRDISNLQYSRLLDDEKLSKQRRSFVDFPLRWLALAKSGETE